LFICFVFIGIYEIFADKKKCVVGRQQDIGETVSQFLISFSCGIVNEYHCFLFSTIIIGIGVSYVVS